MPSTPHRPLNVLVDAVSARRGGGATFLFEQLRALERIAEMRLSIITTEAARSAVHRSCPHSKVISWPMRPLPIRLLREQTTIHQRATGYDVVYLPGNFANARTRRPQVLVLQSLWHFGREARMLHRDCPTAMRMRLATESVIARASVSKADRVICVSETMRSCVAEDLGSLDKITVIPAAAPYFPVKAGPQRVSGPYILSVGTDLPHKDWTGLIRAFERRDDLPPLVLVGWCPPARRRELSVRSNGSVRLLGPVTDRAELADLYRYATCVIAHSHLESYGLTAIEALSMHVPLVASDIPAHREFCGLAARYYDPLDGDALTAALVEAIRAGPVATKAPGLALTWANNADMTAHVLRSAADGQAIHP